VGPEAVMGFSDNVYQPPDCPINRIPWDHPRGRGRAFITEFMCAKAFVFQP
jgi:hypothetical protein